MKIIYITKALLFALFFLFFGIVPSVLNAQEPEETIITDDVIVTAKKIPALSNEATRSIIVISKEEIQNAPVQNIQDLLAYCSGVDVKKRGPEGVQADVSIRGGSFEQTLILIDGLKVSDPQTGHNNMNLPVNISDIEKIEILKGQASNIYGPNALSGAINIITKKSAQQELTLDASGGQNGFYKGGISFSYPIGQLGNTFSFSKSRSDGYRHNTDFNLTTFSYSSNLGFTSGKGNFSIGYTDKNFGANGFYSDIFPNQWEHTKTLFSALGFNYGLGKLSFSPKLFWRNNSDNYLLDYSRPDFYNNDHKTNSYGAEIQTSLITSLANISVGGELGMDDINSSNLGNHERKKGGLSIDAMIPLFRSLKVSIGAFIYNYDNYGWKYWPGINIGYQFSEKVNFFSSIGKSFRIPTFTELYYSSPAQTGNPFLQPEKAVSYEAGVNYFSPGAAGGFSVFLRKGSELIDWIRTASNMPWHAENVTNINTSGFDINFSIHPEIFLSTLPIKKISLSYAFLNSDLKTENYQSKYILDHLKHQFIAELLHALPFNISVNWVFRYESRFNMDEYFVADSKLFYDLKDIEFFLEASNLLNTSYLDFSGIPMPGRWIIGGIKYQLN